MAQAIKTRTVSAFISKYLAVTNLSLLITTGGFSTYRWLALHCTGVTPSLFLCHNGRESVPLANVVFQTTSRAWHLSHC